MGIPWQGLVHDLSKYSPKEFSIYKYYGGTRSPHEVARQELGYSPSWMYHKNRNKHHWEFWLDNQDGADFKAVKMPYKYVIEMFCDFVGAGKAYNPGKWDVHKPYEYWKTRCEGKRLMHPASQWLLLQLLTNMDGSVSEKAFYIWYKKNKKYLKKLYENRV